MVRPPVCVTRRVNANRHRRLHASASCARSANAKMQAEMKGSAGRLPKSLKPNATTETPRRIASRPAPRQSPSSERSRRRTATTTQPARADVGDGDEAKKSSLIGSISPVRGKGRPVPPPAITNRARERKVQKRSGWDRARQHRAPASRRPSRRDRASTSSRAVAAAKLLAHLPRAVRLR